jgi:hypothetical protein
MGKRIIRISPSVLQDLFAEGRSIGKHQILHVTEGIPEGALLLRCWYEGDRYPDGEIVMLFEHERWSDSRVGHRFEEIVPTFRTEVIVSSDDKPLPIRLQELA